MHTSSVAGPSPYSGTLTIGNQFLKNYQRSPYYVAYTCSCLRNRWADRLLLSVLFCERGGGATFAVCLELSILVDHQLINLIAPVT